MPQCLAGLKPLLTVIVLYYYLIIVVRTTTYYLTYYKCDSISQLRSLTYII